jgi:hypothetical protein
MSGAPGFLCESTADRVGSDGRVLGIDVSPDLVELARRRNQHAWLTYEAGDALALAAPDQSFGAPRSRRRAPTVPFAQPSLPSAGLVAQMPQPVESEMPRLLLTFA